MKKHLSLLTAFLAAGSLSTTPALAVEHYVSAFGGVSWMGDVSAQGSHAKLDAGYAVLGAVGCDYGSYRFEAEAGYADNNLKSFNGLDLEGNVAVYSLMANGAYDFDAGGVTPYLMAGVGIAQAGAHNAKVTGSTALPVAQNETTLAYQVGAGVAVPIADNVNLDARYRYFATTDFSTSFGNMNLDSHNLLLGLRVNF
ncbi:MAG: porin family protein [Chlorobiaceae bacterium]|nr:porin family protein [Chlorobiaceae bacterium]NTW74500.1 porin family protein [Chlorobiaceae bacterium]